MATIGSFKKVGNDYQGEIVTLSLQAKGVRIVAETNYDSERIGVECLLELRITCRHVRNRGVVHDYELPRALPRPRGREGDTLMQDRIYQIDETSCNARPDHTFGSKCEELSVSKSSLL